MGVAGWDPGRVWTGAENLALAGIRSPHRLADPYERGPYSDVLYRVFQIFNKILFYDYPGRGTLSRMPLAGFVS
jgi:hypothetical protein